MIKVVQDACPARLPPSPVHFPLDTQGQLQWRFVNRCIDEVEGGRCPGILLVCRNSTDTSYFQRLKPYPRVFLRRDAVQFKDYHGSPIAFGICVLCLAKGPERQVPQYLREFLNLKTSAGDVPLTRPMVHPPVYPRRLSSTRASFLPSLGKGR